MPYESVDQLQKLLVADVFHYAKDAKKAAGRALGTLVEIITFYVLEAWGFERSLAIERPLAEYGNPDITHNVEYSLHPIFRQSNISFSPEAIPLSAAKMISRLPRLFTDRGISPAQTTLLSSRNILRNSCTIARSSRSHFVATLEQTDSALKVAVVEQYSSPFAMVECKRVGVEEGMKKGPQTIEKAKQGAYVAKSVSSLQKVRSASGDLLGIVFKSDGSSLTRPLVDLLDEMIHTDESHLLRSFILTVGVVSNHGNWFSSDNKNKELRVLAQSYDWLLFLSDEGLAQFITDVLLRPSPKLRPARAAFLSSYTSGRRGATSFTKVQIALNADRALRQYFHQHRRVIERWFNVITPPGESLRVLRGQLSQLRAKHWKEVHSV